MSRPFLTQRTLPVRRRPRLLRLGQQPVDELKRWPTLEHRVNVGPVEDQRQARRDHEVGGIELLAVENAVGNPAVDSVEHRWQLVEELLLVTRAGLEGAAAK